MRRWRTSGFDAAALSAARPWLQDRTAEKKIEEHKGYANLHFTGRIDRASEKGTKLGLRGVFRPRPASASLSRLPIGDELTNFYACEPCSHPHRPHTAEQRDGRRGSRQERQRLEHEHNTRP